MKKRNLGLTVCGVVFLALALGAGSSADGQESDKPEADPREVFTDFGRTTRKVIEPSNEGDWDGTWYYVSRDARMVMWIKTEDGLPKVKFQFLSSSSAEGFVTDWEGNAEYEQLTSSGTFSLNIKKRDADVIEGHLDWRLESEHSTREEEGDYRIYRTGDGRFFVMDFSDYRKIVSGTKSKRVLETLPAWTFQKASKRLVLWDELPF
jgi:hypothetical protein